MPGRNVGSIELKVGLDGKGILEEARVEGEAAGEEFSAGFNDRTTKGFTGIGKRISSQIRSEQAQMEGGGQLGADYVGNAFTARLSGLFDSASRDLANSFLKKTDLDKFAANFENADAAAAHLRGELGFLYDEGKLGEAAFNSYGGTLNQWLGSARAAERAAADLAATTDAQAAASERAAAAVERYRVEGIAKLKEDMYSAEQSASRVNAALETFGATQARLALEEARRPHGLAQRFDNLLGHLSLLKGPIADVEKEADKAANALGNLGNGGGGGGGPNIASLFTQKGLIIAVLVLIGAAADSVGVLAEAAAGGVVILANALGAGAVAMGLLAVAATQLMTPLANIAQLQTLQAIPVNQLTKAQELQIDTLTKLIATYAPYIQAISDVKSALSTLAGSIADSVFGPITDQITALTTTFLPGISAGVLSLASTVGTALGNILSGLSSTQGLAEFNALLAGAKPLVTDLIDAAGQLGAAIGNIFIAADPATEGFTKGLDHMLTQFNDFTKSKEGRKEISDFFSNAVQVIGAVIPLVGALGQVFTALVTPDAVKHTTKFIEGLTKFLPDLSKLLGVFSNAQLLNVVVIALDGIGKVLADPKVIKGLGDFTKSLGDFLVKNLPKILDSLSSLPGTFKSVSDGLAPVVDLFTALGPVIDIVAPIIGGIISLVGAIITTLWQLVEGNFGDIGKTWVHFWKGLPKPFTDWVGTTLGMFGDFFKNTVGMFIDFGKNVDKVVAGFLVVVGTSIATFVKNTIGMFVDFFKNTIGMFVDFGKNTVGMFFDIGKNIGAAWNKVFGGLLSIVISAFGPVKSFIKDTINTVIDLIDGMIKGVNKVGAGVGIRIGLIPEVAFAEGGIVRSATRINNYTAGESGDEAIVPLTRALDQVDPSVRALAAYAQGKAYNPGGPNGSSGNQTVIQQGAIQIVAPITSPTIAARLVLDGITGAVSDS